MRLIDADALKHKLKQLAFDYFNEGMSFMVTDAVDNCIDITDGMPTIDPIRHGHWQQMWEDENQIQARCSCCGMVFWIGKGRDGNYCPNCGVKMNEVKK